MTLVLIIRDLRVQEEDATTSILILTGTSDVAAPIVYGATGLSLLDAIDMVHLHIATDHHNGQAVLLREMILKSSQSTKVLWA